MEKRKKMTKSICNGVSNLIHCKRVTNPQKILEARFFAQDSGIEPVRVWLKSLSTEDKKAIGADIKSVEYGWPIGMPIVKNLKQGLWEVRIDLKDRIARVFFCNHGTEMVLLHGIIKKSQQTPTKEIELARKRMKKVGDSK